MFERWKNAWAGRRLSAIRLEPLAQWAEQRGLAYEPLASGAYVLTGHWWGVPVRIECAAPSRFYMRGMELMARADLAQPTPGGGVVVMNRALKHRLEQKAGELYSQYTDTLQTTAQNVPEEIRWLSMYRDAGWSGPDRRFWARYAVLTDAPEAARDWIDDECLQRLMRWPTEAVGLDTPLLLMRLKGKVYMRLQIDQASDGATAAHALDLFHHASEQARRMIQAAR
jgi:hypothetical protein